MKYFLVKWIWPNGKDDSQIITAESAEVAKALVRESYSNAVGFSIAATELSG